MTLADEAELEAARKTSARVLAFQDGLSRHITLTAQQWANLDALLEGGWTEEQLLWVPFDTASEFYKKGEASDFEDELRRCMVTMAKSAWVWHRDRKKQRPANAGV